MQKNADGGVGWYAGTMQPFFHPPKNVAKPFPKDDFFYQVIEVKTGYLVV